MICYSRSCISFSQQRREACERGTMAPGTHFVAKRRRIMSAEITRRETLRRGLAAASLLALVPDWATPALAEGDTDVPFTDIPATFNPNNPSATSRVLDIRKIDGPFTPKEQFFAVQHFNRPEIDPAAYRLKFTGMVHKASEFSLTDLRAMRSTEVAA